MADVELDADLECELNGQPITVKSNGKQILVGAADWSAMLSLTRVIRSIVNRRGMELDAFFAATRTSVVLQIKNRTVATLGYGIRGGLLRLVGWPGVRLHPVAIAVSAIDRRKS